jgi:Ca2+/Na+ antiporter
VVRGVGGFLRPFLRVGGILWLEVTGAFFFLFVVVSGMALWRTRPGHFQGPYDKNFLAAAGIMVVFFYLGVSSFWRARKR